MGLHDGLFPLDIISFDYVIVYFDMAVGLLRILRTKPDWWLVSGVHALGTLAATISLHRCFLFEIFEGAWEDGLIVFWQVVARMFLKNLLLLEGLLDGVLEDSLVGHLLTLTVVKVNRRGCGCNCDRAQHKDSQSLDPGEHILHHGDWRVIFPENCEDQIHQKESKEQELSDHCIDIERSVFEDSKGSHKNDEDELDALHHDAGSESLAFGHSHCEHDDRFEDDEADEEQTVGGVGLLLLDLEGALDAEVPIVLGCQVDQLGDKAQKRENGENYLQWPVPLHQGERQDHVGSVEEDDEHGESLNESEIPFDCFFLEVLANEQG